ncbi:MAG: hypothetical protein AAF652_08625 [Cyanobacteria bacterium P01_C01_bin.72]
MDQQKKETELKLSRGNWKTFPLGKTRVTHLPGGSAFGAESRINPLVDLVQKLILLIASILVGVLAILISPFFHSSLIKRHKKSQSQPGLKE